MNNKIAPSRENFSFENPFEKSRIRKNEDEQDNRYKKSKFDHMYPLTPENLQILEYDGKYEETWENDKCSKWADDTFLATKYIEGTDCKELKNEKLGIQLLIQGVEKRNSISMHELAKLYFSHTFMPDYEKKEFFALFLETVRQRPHPIAHRYLGICCLNGFGTDRNISDAIFHFNQSYGLEDSEAPYHLGEIFLEKYYETREMDHSILRKALENYEKAVERGSVQARTKLGLFFMQGRIVKKDFDTAKQYFSSAYQLGDNTAKIYLDECNRRLYKDVMEFESEINPSGLLEFEDDFSTFLFQKTNF